VANTKSFFETSVKIMALIPARAGSKRIANKNIRDLDGKPLIAYTIEAAKKAKKIERIIVSTDSKTIADISKQYGAEAPFLRPTDISQSHSTEMEFFDHALNWLSLNENYVPDLIVLLYPTCPFRKPESIDIAIDLMQKYPEADSLRSIRLCTEHPYKMWKIENNYLKPFINSSEPNIHTLSYQLLPTVYIQNACIYITKRNTIRNKRSPTGDVIIPFVMDELESLDINNPLDLLTAEVLIQKNKRNTAED
jgi:CMP-N-acetylneuraminic acid synthetase